jgi:hypothetical protein
MKRPIEIAKGASKQSGPGSHRDAIAAFKAGKMIIVVDDEDREKRAI